MVAERAADCAAFDIAMGSYAENSFHVTSFRAREEVSKPYWVEVAFTTDIHPHDLESDLLGTAARFSIRFGENVRRVIDGVVTSVRVEGDSVNHERCCCVVRLVPKLKLLKNRRNTRIFQEMPVSRIVEAILGPANIECDWKLNARYEDRVYCVQYEETDLEFVSRLLAEEGIFYFFAPTEIDSDAPRDVLAIREKLILADFAEAYEPIAGDLEIPYRMRGGITPSEDHIEDFSVQRNVRTGKVTLHDYDFRHPSRDLTAMSQTEDSTDAFDQTRGEEYYHHREDERPNVSKHRSKTRLEQLRVDARVAKGRSNSMRLVPGYVFRLEAHRAEDLNTRYAITRLLHEGSQPDPMLQSAGQSNEPAYVNSFESVFATVPVRPRAVPRVMKQVLETATVVGADGEEIHVDSHGRIKVRFHWDRDGRPNVHSSCWIRVAQTWAGSGWGFQFIPRVGMEVLVTFLGGDQDRPLVTGCVYNQEAPPPYALPDQKTRSGIRTQSTPGGSGSNELRFEDAAGEEQIYVHAQRNYDSVIEHDRTSAVRGQDRLTVERDRYKTVHGNEHHHISQNYTLDVDGDYVRNVKGNEIVTINQNYVLHIVGHKVMTIGGWSDAGGSTDSDPPPADQPPPRRSIAPPADEEPDEPEDTNPGIDTNTANGDSSNHGSGTGRGGGGAEAPFSNKGGKLKGVGADAPEIDGSVLTVRGSGGIQATDTLLLTGNKILLSGDTIEIKAGTKIKLGSATIEISATGDAVIMGHPVKIN